MKSKVSSKIIILSILGIVFALSPVVTTNLSDVKDDKNKIFEYRNDINIEKDNLRISELSEKIHIDYNWSYTEGNYTWCTGSGTYPDPYVIQDLIIDGGDGSEGNCILIENSDVYFRIENCTVYNTVVWGSGHAGIRLYNTSNGQLIENDCFSNSEGIYLLDSNNNTVSGNNVSNCYKGIYLSTSNENIISGNNISGNSNYQGGITILGNNNTISGNILNWYGIGVNGINNTFSGNILNRSGLRLYSLSIESLISLNIDASNLVNGRHLYYYKNEMNLDQNDFFDAGQVILVNCSNSFISNLNISSTTVGITLFYSSNNEILANNVSNNILYGLYLFESHNNFISGNEANNCSDWWLYDGYGIYLLWSNYNTISDNTANNNFGNGIYLVSCNNNQILGNNLTNNYDGGIFIYRNNNNEITGNNVIDNWNGIYLRESINNNVSRNNANSNANGITLRESIDNNISENIVNENERGILIAISSDDNIIIENDVYNNEYGIYLGVSFNNTILRNNANYNGYGIYLAGGFYTSVLQNNVHFNWLYGIYLETSLNNTISENIVNYNSMAGIILDENCDGNIIYLNCFNNTNNARDDGLQNHWDNGIKGNYWADYKGSDINRNGIGDIPYNIPGLAGNQDKFPLMRCPIAVQDGKKFPFELIIIISVISGGAVIGLGTMLLIKLKKKRLESNPK